MPLSLTRYLAQDRRAALARGSELPERATGVALLADIAGFTALGERLTGELGPKDGIEELGRRIDAVYQVLNSRIERHGGSVVGFAGDAMLCWFDSSHGGALPRALSCGQALQNGMRQFEGMGLKVAMASGGTLRMAVGDPAIQRLDVLAGATIERLSTAHLAACHGEVVADRDSVESLAALGVLPREWRQAGELRVAVVEPPATETLGTVPEGTGEFDAEVVRPWMLPAVFERERSGHGAFLTELRPTVALFVQLAGIDYDGDAQAGAKLDTSVRCVQSIAASHGGALLQLTLGEKGGYGYLSFGAPQAQERAALHAVRAALELRAALRELAHLRPTRIGLSGGVSRCGAYGAKARATYGALGDDVNLAARLMEMADPGQILVSAALHRPLAEDFVLQALPPVTIRGRASHMTVHQVAGARRAVRLQERRYAGPMVGRERELAQAEQAVQRAARGQLQIIGIDGEAGVGKSRLMAELLARTQWQGFEVVTGRCEATGQWSPYLAWRPIWRSLLGLGEDDGPAAAKEALRRLVPQREAALPTLAPLLGVPIEDSPFTRSLHAQERINMLTAVLEEALAAAAAHQPLVLAIEDVHWIDPASLQLLEALMRGAGALPLAVVLSYRPPEKPSAPQAHVARMPGFVGVQVRALEPADVARLVADRLASWQPSIGPAVVHALTQRLNAQADGNPFYIEELLNHLRERHVALHEWVEDADPKALELPPSLESLILSRIDRLNETQRAALKMASVIGRQFRVDWLLGGHPALGEITQLKAELAELDRLDLTPLASTEPLAYLFKHAVTREVTYGTVPRMTRLLLHGQLARYIESLGAAQHLELLAHHYGLSDEIDKQREYFRRAAEAAQAAYANETALEHWCRLLPLALDDAQRARILWQQGILLTHIARYGEAETRLRDAMACVQRLGDARAQAEVAESLGMLLSRSGDATAARAWIDRALAAWRSLGAAREEARAMFAKAATWLPGRPDEVQACAADALTTACACGDSATRILATALLGEAAQRLGDGARSQTLLDDAESAAHQLGDKRVLLPVLHRCGIVAAAAGEYARAKSLLVQAHALALEMGDKLRAVETLWLIGNQDNRLGHHAQARSSLEAAATMARQVGAKAALLSVLYGIAYGAVRESDYALARRSLQEARGLAESLQDRPRVCKSIVGLGYVDLSEGDLDRAEAAFVEAMSIVDTYHLPMLRAEVLDKLGLVALAQGRLDAAERDLLEVLGLRRGSGHVESLAYTLAKVAALRARQDRHQEAAVLAAAVQGACRATGFALDAYTERLIDEAIAAARSALPEAALGAACERGSALDVDATVRLALGA